MSDTREQPVERWGTTVEDYEEDRCVGCVGDCGVCPTRPIESKIEDEQMHRERTSLFHPTPAEANAAALSAACGACGSTTGAAFYERGPLAGLRRCWPCARPALMTMEER